MVVRIHWAQRSKGGAPFSQQLASALAALLTPAALIAFIIFFWSITAELHWKTNFFISSGFFSHWQVWLAASAVLLSLARLLNRYAAV